METALITGGGGGIGRETALAFAARGVSVVVADIDEAAARAAASAVEAAGGEALGMHVDVTDDESVASMVETTVETYDGFDAAVNAAGVAGEQSALTDYSESGFERVVDVNLLGTWRAMKHELRAMDEGAIVNVTSILGLAGYERTGGYVATKHGVVGLTRTAALEAAKRVRVNAVAPGFTETTMLDDAGVNRDQQTREYVAGLHPMDRFGDPEEVAEAIVWLCSPAASFVTGTVLPVDGGYLAK